MVFGIFKRLQPKKRTSPKVIAPVQQVLIQQVPVQQVQVQQVQQVPVTMYKDDQYSFMNNNDMFSAFCGRFSCRTPYPKSCDNWSNREITTFLNIGVHLNLQNTYDNKRYILEYITKLDRHNIIKLLAIYGVNVILIRRMNTLKHEFILLLLTCGAQVNLSSNKPIINVEYFNEKSIEYLFDFGIYIDTNYKCLFWVNSLKNRLYMLNAGVDVNLRNGHDVTVLQHFADFPKKKFTKLLTIYGANLNVRNENDYGILDEHDEYDNNIIKNEQLYLVCGIHITFRYKKIIVKELLEKKKYTQVYNILESDLSLAKHLYKSKMDNNLQIWFFEQYPKHLHGYKKKMYIHFQNKFEKIQYQISPGEEFTKLIKEDFPHVSPFDIFKMSMNKS